MNLVDRFTRDRVSRVVWGLCLFVALGLLALAVVVGRTAADDERSASEARAVRYARAFVQPSVADSSFDEPLDNDAGQRLMSDLSNDVLIDARVKAVRLWSGDGTLLFSSEPGDETGSQWALNDDQLGQALAFGAPVTVSGRSSAEDPARTPELITYVGIASSAERRVVVDVAQDFDMTVGFVESRWFRLQMLAGALVLLFLALTILSFREPIAGIGAGVGFVAEAVPPGYAVIEVERLRSVNDVYDLAQERVLRLKESLRRSEEARMASEGELQRVLSKFESSKSASEPSEATDVAATEAVGSGERAADPEPMVLPEPAVAGSTDVLTASAVPDIVELRDTDEDDTEIARDLLLRMIDTEVPMAESGVDPGEVRAKLARTAARKKPGGGERKFVEEEPVQEMPPWARNR